MYDIMKLVRIPVGMIINDSDINFISLKTNSNYLVLFIRFQDRRVHFLDQSVPFSQRLSQLLKFRLLAL